MQNASQHFCHPNASIRVIWVSSMLNLSTPDGGVQLLPSTTTTTSTTTTRSIPGTTPPWIPKQLSGMQHYMQTKAGVYLLSQEFARRSSPSSEVPTSTSPPSIRQNPHGVLHIALNPGFLKTNLQRNAPAPLRGIMGALFKGPKYGAYTELYAGLAPDVRQGDFVIPWGRIGSVPEHVSASTKVTKEGLESVGARFYEWCEAQVKPYM
jgi:retinol dehydrogenase-12